MVTSRGKLKIACPSCQQKLDLSELEPFTRLPCPACDAEVIAPKPFGALMLEELLGGAEGLAIYRALDLALDREVAVKVLESKPEKRGEAFLELARHSAAINHAGVVPIYSCGQEQGSPFFVCQFMAGGTLWQHLGTGPGTDEEVRRLLDWGRTISGGLHAAHSQGLMHGAVGPGSVFLDVDGNAKVGDFGLAVLFSDDSPEALPLSEMAPYIAPERLAGAAADFPADVFGLGVLLYRLLTGVSPVLESTDSEAMAAAWREAEIVPVRERVPAVPREASDICDALLRREPSQRPSDLREVTEILASACKTKANARSAPDRRHHGVKIHVPVARRLSEVQAQLVARRQRRGMGLVNLLIAISVLLVVLLVALAYFQRARLFGSDGADERTGGKTPTTTITVENDSSVVDAGVSRGVGGIANSAAAATTKLEPDEDVSRRLAARLARCSRARPRPSDLDFARVRDSLTRYMRSLPAELVEGERQRLKYVATTKAYLIRLMKYLPFNDGQETSIELRGGQRVLGSIPYCNEREVAVRRADGAPLRVFAWGDLAFAQYTRFLEYYVDRRRQGQTVEGARNAKQDKEIGDDLLRLAVLCEWYGREDLSRWYAERVVRQNSASKRMVFTLLPFLLPRP